MIEIKNLHANIDGKPILKGFDLMINGGEIHAIMGPNGAGKSTLSYILAGKEGYDVTQGDILFNGESILDMAPDERAAAGLFLAFQYPVEIPGVLMTNFLKTSLNAVRKARGESEMETLDFIKRLRAKTGALGIKDEMLKRGVNVGFSGGEKKRNEVLQMAMLEPAFCVMDETDSGLDIDALKIVADGVNALRDQNRSFLIITHYQRLLDLIVPDHVHIMSEGRIIQSGGPQLAKDLEAQGYSGLIGEVA